VSRCERCRPKHPCGSHALKASALRKDAHLRVHRDDWVIWKAAAREERVGLTEWIRRACLHRAGQEISR
jgi:hypothetical protein